MQSNFKVALWTLMLIYGGAVSFDGNGYVQAVNGSSNQYIAEVLDENDKNIKENLHSITPEDLKLFPNIETLNLYTKNDLKIWETYEGSLGGIKKIEVWVPIEDRFIQCNLRRLIVIGKKNGNSVDKVNFRNVKLTRLDIVGEFDQNGKYIFKRGVYTTGELKDSDFVIITEIGDHVFSGDLRLRSITIPDSVKSIGYGAFRDCSNLNELTIGKNVKIIRDRAFIGCNSLYDIIIPDNVTSISSGAFDTPSKLIDRHYADIIVPNESMSRYLRSCGIKNTMVFTSIAKSNPANEWGWPDDGKMVIPNSVTSIDDNMFNGRTDIRSINIPDSVKSIGCYAFAFARNLESLVIGKGVEAIKSDAFRCCDTLNSVYIQGDVQSIEVDAFSMCDNARFYVTSEQMVNKLHSEHNIEKYRIFINGKAADYEDELKLSEDEEVITPQSDIILEINPNIVEELVLSRKKVNWKWIWTHTKSGKLQIPNKYTAIDNSAFEGHKSIKVIVIPDSVTTIGKNAFRGCKNLTKIYVYSDRVKQLIIDSQPYINPDIIDVIQKPEEK